MLPGATEDKLPLWMLIAGHDPYLEPMEALLFPQHSVLQIDGDGAVQCQHQRLALVKRHASLDLYHLP
jgi:hypothetical protein